MRYTKKTAQGKRLRQQRDDEGLRIHCQERSKKERKGEVTEEGMESEKGLKKGNKSGEYCQYISY